MTNPAGKYGHWDLFGDTIEHRYAHWGLIYSDDVCFPMQFSIINWNIHDDDGGYWEIVASVYETFDVKGQRIEFEHKWESNDANGITFDNREDAMNAVDEILAQLEAKSKDGDW